MADTTIETALFTILTGDATVTGLVGKSVYPNLVPQGAQMPAITYQQITSLREHVMTDTLGIVASWYQINCWAESYSEARELSEAVRIALADYSGTVSSRDIKAILLENEGDMPMTTGDVEGRRRYGKNLDFVVWHDEAII